MKRIGGTSTKNYSVLAPLLAGLLFLAVAVGFGISYLSVDKISRFLYIQERNYALIFGAISVFAFVVFFKGRNTEVRTEVSHEELMELKEKGGNSTPIRYIEPTDKAKVIVEATVENYHITYRRAGLTNELAVGRHVYDEIGGLIKTPHTLYAVVNGHVIEAGMLADGAVFIKFDDNFLERKYKLWM